MNDDMYDERLTALEVKLAHMEQHVEEIHEALLEQVKGNARLKAKLKMTEGRIEAMGAPGHGGDDMGLSPSEMAERDKPPHY